MTAAQLFVEIPEFYQWFRFRTESYTAFWKEIHTAAHAAKAGIDVRFNDCWVYPEMLGFNLRAMAPRLTDAASLLLPGSELHAVIYSCTSGTTVIGAEEVSARIRAAKPGVPCSTPLTAAEAALTALGIERVAVLTPYLDEVNQTIRDHLQRAGLGVARSVEVVHREPSEVLRSAPGSARRVWRGSSISK